MEPSIKTSDPLARKYLGFILWGVSQGLVASLIWLGFVGLKGHDLLDYLPFTVPVIAGGIISAVVFKPLLRKPLRIYWVGFPLVSILIPWLLVEVGNWISYRTWVMPGGGGFELLLAFLWTLPLLALSLLWSLALRLWQWSRRR